MVRTYLLRSRDVAIGLLASFLLGYVVGGSLGRVPAPSSPPPTPVGEYEERAVAEAIRRELLREGGHLPCERLDGQLLAVQPCAHRVAHHLVHHPVSGR